MIAELTLDRYDEATALWRAADLVRPWNEPYADLARAADNSTSTVLGLVDGDVLVGTVMAGYEGHRGWIYYLAVLDERRGKGHGIALVRAAEQWLAERGAPKVQLMVRRTNDKVVGFYEALGYEQQDVVVLGRFLP